MHSSALLTMPKTKDRQEALESHCAWHADAVVMPVGCDRGVWLPLPAGALPHVARAASLTGDAETPAMRADAATMEVNECMLIEVMRILDFFVFCKRVDKKNRRY
jgi:hypothetical protein